MADPKVDLSELGTSGLKRTTGYVYDEFLTRLRGIQGIRTYREMSDNDPVIGAILFAIEKVITRLEWRVDPYRDETSDGEPDKTDVENAHFVESCLNDMSDSWDSTLSQILSMCVYGWSYHEIVYKTRQGPEQKDPSKRSKFDDGKVGWRKWAIRGQETLYLWTFDDDGGIQGMQQIDPYSGHGRVEIPIEKALLFRTTAQKNNPEGRSLLRNAFRPWWFKRRIEEIEAIGIERDLAGLPVAMVPPEFLSATATAEQRNVLESIKTIVTSIKRNENEGIVFPMYYDESGKKMFDLMLLSSGGTRQFDIDKTLTRLDQRIAMSVLSDFILLGQDRVGSFALGVTKMDLWSMAIDSIAKTIADTINTHALPRLMRLNGLDVTRPPKVMYSEVAHVDLGEIGQFVSQMAQAGIIAPDPDLEDHLRDLAGLPPANHNVEDTGVDTLSSEDAKAVMALPPQQRLMAQRTGVVPNPPAFPGGNPQFNGGDPQADEPAKEEPKKRGRPKKQPESQDKTTDSGAAVSDGSDAADAGD